MKLSKPGFAGLLTFKIPWPDFDGLFRDFGIGDEKAEPASFSLSISIEIFCRSEDTDASPITFAEAI
jgi:hypothetical protein